jgi:hypothetical protein
MHLTFSNLTNLILSLLLLLSSCREPDQYPETKPDRPFTELPDINTSFPFGCTQLLSAPDSIYWEIDPYADDEEEESPGQKAFDELRNCYRGLNEVYAVKYESEINSLVPLLVPSRQFANESFDTTLFFRTDSLKYRLPDAGRYHCYYFYQSIDSLNSEYGNLMLTDSLSGKSWVINIYHSVAAEQHLKFRFYFFTQDGFLLMDGSLYDDGCRLRKAWRANFDKNGKLIIKNTHI